MKRSTLVITLTLLLVSLPAVAQDLAARNYQSFVDLLTGWFGEDDNAGLTTLPSLNIPMGGRAESLALAFSAIADDASFLELNPAGSANLPNTELAFFHNNWIANSKIEGLVYSIRWDDLAIAAGGKWLYVDFSEYNQYGARASKGFYSELVATLNLSYKLFSGYYFDGLALGLNLKGAGRFVPNYSDDEGSIDPESGSSQSGLTLMADLGLLTRFNLLKFYHSQDENASVSLVARNFGLPLLGDPLPSVLVGGFSYRPVRPVQMSFDFMLPVNLTDFALSAKPYGALGISAQFTPFLAMRTGFMLRMSAWRFTLGSGIRLNGIDLDITYTLDQLTQFKALNRLSLAARFDLGDRGRKSKAQRVRELYLDGLNEYSQGNQAAAKKLWEEALALDPKFDPAIEGLRLIEGSENLDDRIDDIQQLE